MGRAHKLSPLQVKNLSKAGRYGDGAGLMLNVTTGGSKSWIFRYMISGRDHWMGLGPYPDVGLAEARELATENRKKIRNGIDPLEERESRAAEDRANSAKAVTFDWCAQQYIEAHRPTWSNPKHAEQWASTLRTYAAPIIGKLDVSRIETSHIMKILEPEWLTKTETLSRLRGRIERILDWATVRKYRTGENPARLKGHLEALLPPRSRLKVEKHFTALPYAEMAPFMTDLRKQEGIAAKACEFAILTAARSGEVRGATWSEIDMDAALWTIPAERMKAAREHRVTLSKEALSLLRTMQELSTDPQLIFPGRDAGRPLSDMSLTAVLKRMKRPVTMHGFRSSFRDWAAEISNYPKEMADMALAHKVADKVEAAYRRGDMVQKRRAMMQDWADYCEVKDAEENEAQEEPQIAE
ncbi:DUF4102 domain-containing protein [Denitromonas halophila]|uniref:DUF4102 domain-containing protein n=2 Tax=Denitromonas halophila TaxID=1629404 RepID=A0A557QJT9_9RHOO|nr:DUF4102 domain-containing protein [Denitromonas halophila]